MKTFEEEVIQRLTFIDNFYMITSKHILYFFLIITVFFSVNNFALGAPQEDELFCMLAKSLAEHSEFNKFLKLEKEDQIKIDYDMFYRGLLLALHEQGKAIDEKQKDALFKALEFTKQRRFKFPDTVSDCFNGNQREKDVFNKKDMAMTALYMIALIQEKKDRSIELTSFDEKVTEWFNGLKLVDKTNVEYTARDIFNHCNKNKKVVESIMYPDETKEVLWQFCTALLNSSTTDFVSCLRNEMHAQVNSDNSKVLVDSDTLVLFNATILRNDYTIPAVLDLCKQSFELKSFIFKKFSSLFRKAVSPVKRDDEKKSRTASDTQTERDELFDAFQESDSVSVFLRESKEKQFQEIQIELALLTNGKLSAYSKYIDGKKAKAKAKAEEEEAETGKDALTPREWTLEISAAEPREEIGGTTRWYPYYCMVAVQGYKATKFLHIMSDYGPIEVTYVHNKHMKDNRVIGFKVSMKYQSPYNAHGKISMLDEIGKPTGAISSSTYTQPGDDLEFSLVLGSEAVDNGECGKSIDFWIYETIKLTNRIKRMNRNNYSQQTITNPKFWPSEKDYSI